MVAMMMLNTIFFPVNSILASGYATSEEEISVPSVVPAIRNMVPVQKGVYYCPGHEFYGFDIYVISENDGQFLPVEETDALFPDEKNGICITEGFRREGGFGEDYSSDFLCERIHPESARILGVYKDDFYKGEPCFTVNDFGEGRAYYIATRPEPAFLDALVRLLIKDCRLNVPFAVKGAVEVTVREKNNNKTFFVICQDPEGGLIDLGAGSLTDRLTEKSLSGSISLRFRDVLVLEKNRYYSQPFGL